MDMTNQPNKATVKDGLPTAEEILRKHFLCDPNNQPLDEVYVGETTAIYSAMQSYSDQQNAELRERVKELEGVCEYALKVIKAVNGPFGATKPIIEQIEKVLKK